MNKKNRLSSLIFVLTIFLCGCGEVSSKYDGKVTAIINKEVDTFTQPVEEKYVNEYYDKSNRLGFELYINNDDKNKIVSPITLCNTLLDLSNIFDDDFSNNIEKVIPNYKEYIDAKELSKTQLNELYTKRVVWMDYALALKHNTSDINYSTFSDFDFYLVNNMNKNRNETVNNYVKEKLEIEDDIILDTSGHTLELVGINILNGNIILNSNDVSYKTDVFQGKDILNEKQYLSANNVSLKYHKENNISIIEFPLESNNRSMVLDILISNNDENISDVLKTKSYDYLLNLITSVTDKNYVTFKSFQMPIIDNIYNLYNNEYLKESNLGFLFNSTKLNIGDNKLENISLNQLNQVNKFNIGVSDKVFIENKEDSFESIKIDKSFTYIVRDKTNNTIVYIADFDN